MLEMISNLEIASHGMSFSTASLTVSEASGHSSFKDRLHKRFGRIFVDFFIITCIVESVIESKMLVF